MDCSCRSSMVHSQTRCLTPPARSPSLLAPHAGRIAGACASRTAAPEEGRGVERSGAAFATTRAADAITDQKQKRKWQPAIAIVVSSRCERSCCAALTATTAAAQPPHRPPPSPPSSERAPRHTVPLLSLQPIPFAAIRCCSALLCIDLLDSSPRLLILPLPSRHVRRRPTDQEEDQARSGERVERAIQREQSSCVE